MSIALSVIIPAYNAEAFIGRTLSSLLTQMDGGVEILVVNDGSQDDTAKAVEEIISGNPGARVALLGKPNGGVSSARNWGLERAEGTFVFFLDADDWVSDTFIENLLPLLQSNSVDMVYWPFDLVNEQGITLQPFPYPAASPPLGTGLATLESILLNRSTRICAISAAYKRAFLLKHNLQYTVGCTAGEDLEFTYSALSLAQKTLYTDRLTSYYLQHTASAMHSYNIKKFSAVRALERLRDRLLNQENPEFDAIIRHIENFDIPHSYAGTYAMCLRHLMDAEKLRPGAAIKRLDGEIDALFPGLGGQIKQMLAKRPRKALPDKLDLFRLSPLLYARLSGLRQVGNA